MEISQFELLFKPQAPAAPEGLAAVDRVIQGYFLQITNLEDQEYEYALEFVAPPPAPAVANAQFRSLAGNALVFVDTPSSDNQQGVLTGTFASSVFRPSTGRVIVPPEATALVAVLPSAFGCLPGESTPIQDPVFEARGFVRLTLPALRTGPGFPGLQTEPQSEGPVRVMLTAQNRTTYLTSDGSISDQTQASLPLCSGAACNAIDPEPGFNPGFQGPFDFLPLEPFMQMIEAGDLQNPAAFVAGILATLDTETADLTGFNKALKAAGIQLAIERRKS
jgi:hypothetical protein